MDDQDWINLQKLIGRSPQPPLMPDERPDHLLYADAVAALGPPIPQLDPEELANRRLWAQAVATYDQPDGAQTLDGGPAPSPQAVLFSASYDPGSASLSGPTDTSPASPPSGGTSAAAGSDAPTQYAMASPADLDLPWQTMADQYATPTPKPARPPSPPAPAPSAPPPALQTTIDPIPGYDQTGDNAWRAANDKIFLDAVNRYNAANGYRPGDPGYWTADMLKAQAMRESGGTRDAFLTDPLQVNSHVRDWDPKKKTIAGLEKGQAMTPEASADAALKWLKYKGWYHGNYLGDVTAVQKYNGRTDRVPGLPNVTFSELYAATIAQLAREAAQARAPGTDASAKAPR